MLPITCATAIASPMARAKPSMTARSGRRSPEGSRSARMTSHRVAPSASAPCLSSDGTLLNSSRLMLAMIGIIMIVRIRHAGRTPALRRVAGEQRDESQVVG